MRSNDGQTPRPARRVAFVFVSMPVGGAEDFALAAGARLGPEYEARFVCLRDFGQLGEEASAEGKPVQLAPFFLSRWVSPLAVRRFAAWLRAEDISLVHSQNHHAHIFATRAAKIAGIPSVVHQQKTLGALPWRRRRIFRGCLRRADRVIALSPQTARDLAREYALPPAKVRVVPNAIDKDLFRPAEDRAAARRELGLPAEGILLGTVARLHPDKNHEAVIGALELLGRRGIAASAFFAGEGARRAELEALVRAKGLGGKIIFAGRQRPVAPWIQACDFFVLPSTWEGQPLALLQAIACGVPVLASRIEGNTEILGEDHPGLFPPRDHAALAQLVAAGTELREEILARQARIAVPGGAEAAAQLKEIYGELLP